MSVHGRDEYLNEYFTKREYGDFTTFYVTITICLIIFLALVLLNFTFCCCSQYKDYWLDNNTGNRWILPIWTRTPQGQSALDYSELEGKAPPPVKFEYPEPYPEPTHSTASTAAYSGAPQYYTSGYGKRESDI